MQTRILTALHKNAANLLTIHANINAIQCDVSIATDSALWDALGSAPDAVAQAHERVAKAIFANGDADK